MSDKTILSHEWQQLRALRKRFLEGSAGKQDYWENFRLLELYNQTFAERIAWKWQSVLSELHRLRWQPPTSAVLDWGCGTGIASRAFLRAFALPNAHLTLYDRSALAVKFAEQKHREAFPQVSLLPFSDTAFQGVVLLSHIITELSMQDLAVLLQRLRAAAAILWVESGEYHTSRKLIDVREQLRSDFHIVAPCTHQRRCGLLTEENAPHWCHHFAHVPQAAFTEKRWSEFRAHIGIDLSQLPLSYLVLDKRVAPALPHLSSRLIGGTRLYKGYAAVLACSEQGVAEYRLSKRHFPQVYRQMKNGEADTLVSIQAEHGNVVHLESIAVQEMRKV
ncbi:MAG: small ribosomal subunit Rsm22 family protein [Candidatus Thermochlorobacter sp.]